MVARRLCVFVIALCLAPLLLLRASSLQTAPRAYQQAGTTTSTVKQASATSSAAQSGSQPNTSPGQSSNQPSRADAERTLERDRLERDNGISVDEPKVYDDSLLQSMLHAAEAKLAATQIIDQAGIASRIGALTGATQRISSVGINVQTPSIPGVTTNSKGATSSTADTSTQNVSTERKLSTIDTAQRTTGAAAQDVATTALAFGPPTATVPAATTTLPSSFSVSASDALNEQMQLTYEIANLRLLLEGALSDHMLITDKGAFVKPRTTLGFPIAIDAQDRYKNAVAVVEVELEAAQDQLLADQKPSITALLPREKTYNVAAITDSSMSIGGGVATSVVGLSGSWLTGHKTYYVTQDQDTIALTYVPENRKHVGFRWQFRPVLGQSVVRSGLKQTFVQLAFPSPQTACHFGTMTIRTYWVKYDKRRGTVGKIVDGSLRESSNRTVGRLPIRSDGFSFNMSNLEDLGGGQMLVSIPGRFLSGTYLRIGSTFLREGSPNLTFENFGLRFTAPILDLATRHVAIVARDGEETPLTMDARPFVDPCSPPPRKATPAPLSPPPQSPPTHATATVTGLDDSNAMLVVDLGEQASTSGPPRVLLIGDKVFGYSDAPVTRSGNTISAVIPLALLLGNSVVTVKQLFISKAITATVQGVAPTSHTERLVQLSSGKEGTKYLLYGSRLSTLTVIEPADAKLGSIGRTDDADTLRTLTLTPEHLKTFKQIVLQRKGERPFLLPMLSTEKPPGVTARERVVVAADAAFFQGDSLDTLTKVTAKNQTLQFEVQPDGKTVRVFGLKAAGLTVTPTSQSFDFLFKAGKATATLDVVNSRVETVARN